MKIIVVSDSHGADNSFIDVLEENKDATHLFFLGDGEKDFETARYYSPHLNFYAVRGNCDLFSDLNDQAVAVLGGKKIFYTHGHLFGVKSGYGYIEAKGKEKGADIVLFGHTHIRLMEERDGIILMNPGSLHSGCYGIIEIENGKINCKTKRR